MADEVRQTPVPVPHIYGQPTTGSDAAGNTGEALGQAAPAQTVEQPSTDAAASAPAPTTEQAPSPLPTNNTAGAPLTSNAPSPLGRTGTPLRTTANGQEKDGGNNANSSSRAASQHPDPGFTMPSEAPPHGAPVRQYLNSKVTGPLLDGMKIIAKEQPKDPLRTLGEYLIQRSKDLEASSSSST
ncbi:uncharacterized protein F4822DRAFT_420077 [Hypoxylon trugodes]|uniref:uncharacterized protein n=1 Tax=Hypoxylon trugodes TaxID=326681 RepID=UPI0021909BC8|nr:uncharacterized protein F4822DRAFT_420077 [Hypoxylon trugodes]KAI1383290.1 hypothetical protein F4822DRAFT_420077 [Hypoxylon trugodes]